MATPLIPQEVFLLERYSSLEYFRPVRDHWEAMIKHVERCLEAFVQHLPPDYRKRPLPKQPDIVWGERILPNFRDTMQRLYRGYIMASHGNVQGLGAASGVGSDHRGQAEFWYEWMDEPQVAAQVPGGSKLYWDLLRAAGQPAFNIQITIYRHWDPTDLSSRYHHQSRGALNPPERWPRYRLNPSVQVKTGEIVTRSGIYLPDIDNSCAQLQVANGKASKAYVLIEITPDEFPVTEKSAAVWTLIERVPGETIPQEEGLGPVGAPPPLRVPAGQPCPQSGWWFTPAKSNSRRCFQAGEIFPNIEGSPYGATFWLWSPDQSSPKP